MEEALPCGAGTGGAVKSKKVIESNYLQEQLEYQSSLEDMVSIVDQKLESDCLDIEDTPGLTSLTLQEIWMVVWKASCFATLKGRH